MQQNNITEVLQDTLQTMLHKSERLIIPVINELYGTDYPEDSTIDFFVRDWFPFPQLIKSRENNFCIGDDEDKSYQISFEASNDGGVFLIFYERTLKEPGLGSFDGSAPLNYDFPNTKVLRIRNGQSSSPNLKFKIGEGTIGVEFDIPIVNLEDYSSDDLFEKHLFFLIPFYFLRFE